MKIRCIKGDNNFTLNKIYDFENCIIIDDNGHKYVHCDLKNLNYCLTPQFVEVKEINIGDNVYVTDAGLSYDLYRDFIKENKPELLKYWVSGKEINKELIYEVVFIKDGKAIILGDKIVYIMGLKGLKKTDGHFKINYSQEFEVPNFTNFKNSEYFNNVLEELKLGNIIGTDREKDDFLTLKENPSLSFSKEFETLNKSFGKLYDTEILNKKKEGKEMKILNIYENKIINKIKEEHKKEMDKILKEDENVKEYYKIRKMAEKYNEKMESEVIILGYVNELQILTDKNTEKLNELNEFKKEKYDALDRFLQEVRARLELCETEESKIEVLKLYSILNEKGMIIEV